MSGQRPYAQNLQKGIVPFSPVWWSAWLIPLPGNWARVLSLHILLKLYLFSVTFQIIITFINTIIINVVFWIFRKGILLISNENIRCEMWIPYININHLSRNVSASAKQNWVAFSFLPSRGRKLSKTTHRNPPTWRMTAVG